MKSVQDSYATRLNGDDLDLLDSKYWSMVVPPNRTHKFCRGMKEQETEDLHVACLANWATYTAGFGQFDEDNHAGRVSLVLNDDAIAKLVSFNEDAELPQGLPPARRNELNEAQWVHLNQFDVMIIKKLNWLKYDTLAPKTLLPVGPSIEEVVDEPGSGAGETVRPAKNPHNFTSPSVPQRKGAHPASTIAPGIERASEASTYSYTAADSAWPVVALTNSMGILLTSRLMHAGRMPPADGRSGKSCTACSAYLLSPPRLTGSRAFMKSPTFVPQVASCMPEERNVACHILYVGSTCVAKKSAKSRKKHR